ncbi:MAG: GDSL-type esterase/lipase family protein [Verrucomicrobiota bacterium]
MLAHLKKALVGLLVTLVLLVVLEGLCSVGWVLGDYRYYKKKAHVAAEFKEEFHSRHDPEIGWVHIPGKQLKDFYGPGKTMSINADGLRGREDYVGKKPAGKKRVLLLGDSFTLGYGVDDSQTFTAHLQQLHPGIQFVNMGQGGYSIGQCYQWFKREGMKLQPDAVVFSFIVDDFWRMASTRTGNGFATPDYQLSPDGTLQISGTPLPGKIGKGEALVEVAQKRRFLLERISLARTMAALVGALPEPPKQKQRAEVYEVGQAIIDRLRRELAAQHIPLVLVLLPEYNDLTQATFQNTYQGVSRALTGYCQPRNQPYVDLYPAFQQVGPPAEGYFLQEQWRHYSESGNAFVANLIHQYLSHALNEYLTSNGQVPGNPLDVPHE